MNAVAAIKAHRRNDDLKARKLLARGYERVGLVMPEADVCEQVRQLADGIRRVDPAVAGLAQDVLKLVDDIVKDDGRGGES